MSSVSNPSPRLRPDDGGQENNPHAQLLVPTTGTPVDQPDADLERGSTNVGRSSHKAALPTNTPRQHNVSPNTDGPSENERQPSNQPAPRQRRLSGIVKTFQALPKIGGTRQSKKYMESADGTLLRSLMRMDPSLFIDAELGEDGLNKVIKHLKTLQRHNPITILEALFKHNLLFSRAKLYQLFLELRPMIHNPTLEVGPEPTSESTSFRRIDDLRQALGDYSSAMEAYRTFRKEPGKIDGDDYMMMLAGMLTELDNKRSQLKATQGPGAEAAAPSAAEEEICSFEVQIAHALVRGARLSPAGVSTEEESKARLSFLGRLAMAIFGGAALVVPMLVMSLRPSKLTGLLTTSLFVVGVAVALAWFMTDAAPKDILAATAAYAAVLVVFVGTDGE